MNYVAYLVQEGEGCDYTICCAQTVAEFEADNKEEALKKLEDLIEECYNYDECRLEKVDLYEVSSSIEVDIKGIYKKLSLSKEERLALEKEKTERAELARLKLKYEK